VAQFEFSVAGAGRAPPAGWSGSPGCGTAVEFELGRGFVKTPAPATPRHFIQTEPLPRIQMLPLRNICPEFSNPFRVVCDHEIMSGYSDCIDFDAKISFDFGQNLSRHNSTYPKNPHTPTLVEETIFRLTL